MCLKPVRPCVDVTIKSAPLRAAPAQICWPGCPIGIRAVGCIVTVYNDKTFALEIKSSPASVLICEAAGIEKGSGVPNKEKVGNITRAQCEKIAKEKLADLNTTTLDAACRIIAGQARSMGVTVEGV